MHQLINAVAEATGADKRLAVGLNPAAHTEEVQDLKVWLGNNEIVLVDTPPIEFDDSSSHGLSTRQLEIALEVNKLCNE